MAKFKVGQQVFVKGDDTPRTIEWYDPKKGYAISGEAIYYPEEDIVAANKKKAKNTRIEDLKVGDRVMVRYLIGFTPTEPKPGVVTAIFKSDNRVAVKKDDGGRGLFDAGFVTKVKNSVAANAVTITKDSRQADNWVTGKVNGYYFEAKVYDTPSPNGINGGRVSKLWMRDVATREVVCDYDRGWSVRPQTPEAKEAMKEVLAKMKALPPVANSVACNSRNPVVAKALNACRNATACNGSVVLYTDAGDTKRVYEGGKVTFDGKPYTAKALGSPQMDKATLVDDSGNEVVVRLMDTRLKAANAQPAARNATEAEAAQYLSAAKSRIRGEIATLKDVASLLKMKPTTPTVEAAYGKVAKAMAALQKAFAELA